ncbi:hypothetical protein AVEN_212856-1 [Araneus ventricosus]|uniref:Peptidase aspartic putative domain-containing protein n=1 Tax=Araneus ventricosus TaxID=182803 RepID=A0A4Y2SGU9_ARAVE|nr:hypothetical protein AVEN_202202-1 [Araneus ventricosus]GBN87387.1 hypothetical protein AVEN_212856-1 [Araneus ventricosus]
MDGESKELAWRRLTSLWNQLSRNPELSQLYRQFMHEYEEMEHMEEMKEECEPAISYYIPHQDIHRPEKGTTKLRVVFDTSASSSNGIFSNSLQINGVVVQEDLFSILCRFRKHRIVLTADIKRCTEWS